MAPSSSHGAEERAPFVPQAPQDRMHSSAKRRLAMVAAGSLAAVALLALAAGGAGQRPLRLASMRGKAAVSFAEEPAVESLGVSAMTAEAEAKHNEVKSSEEAAKAIDQAIQSQTETAEYLTKQAQAQLDHANTMLAEVEDVKHQGAQEAASAKQIQAMAEHDLASSGQLEKQAEQDIVGASKIITEASGSSAEEIRKVAEQQQKSAKEAKERASSQMTSAQKMQEEAKAMQEKAAAELSAAQLVNETAVKEMAAAETIKKQVTTLNDHSKNMSAQEANITGSLKEAKASSDLLNATAKKEEADWVESSKKIADAAAQKDAAAKQETDQTKNLHAAEALYNSSQQELSVAHAMLSQLESQMGSMEDVTKLASGVQDSVEITSIIKRQSDATEEAKGQAQEEIVRATKLGKKAQASEAEATDALETAKAAALKAQKMMEEAQAVQAKINTPGAINDGTTGVIQAMMSSVSEAVAASETIDEAVHFERLALEAAKAQASSETADAQALSNKAAGLGSKSGVAETLTSLSEKEVHSAAAVAAWSDERATAIANLEALGVALGQKATQLEADAKAREDAEFDSTYQRRVCVDLPGVRMTGTARSFERIVGASVPPATVEECAKKCREQVACRQSIFVADNKGCYLSDASSSVPQEFTDGYNASFCGEPEEKDALLAQLQAVYKQMPWIPPVNHCSWADEDCTQTHCCNNVDCDWKFNCKGYQCYKRDDYFASCKLGAPGGYDPTPVGGQREVRMIAPAEDGILVQGTSLFCFSVVMWHAPPTKAFYSTEAELADNWMQKGLGIMQCDDHIVFEGKPAPKSSWGSFSNIDAFIAIWDEVKQDGRWKQHDWIVKVDTDAVFFPGRLKSHLNNLRTPQGSKVYLRNNEYRFQFMGALEILSRQALELYYDNAERCSTGGGGHSGGEDFYMKACLEGLGVDYQQDFQLLHDRYAGQEGCGDGWSVAFHFYKKVFSWSRCHEEACGQGNCL